MRAVPSDALACTNVAVCTHCETDIPRCKRSQGGGVPVGAKDLAIVPTKHGDVCRGDIVLASRYHASVEHVLVHGLGGVAVVSVLAERLGATFGGGGSRVCNEQLELGQGFCEQVVRRQGRKGCVGGGAVGDLCLHLDVLQAFLDKGDQRSRGDIIAIVH